MPPEKFVPIWEDCKDMGVLVGKGGLYGNVSTHFRDINIILVLCLCRYYGNFVLFPLDEYHSRYMLIQIQIIFWYSVPVSVFSSLIHGICCMTAAHFVTRPHARTHALVFRTGRTRVSQGFKQMTSLFFIRIFQLMGVSVIIVLKFRHFLIFFCLR